MKCRVIATALAVVVLVGLVPAPVAAPEAFLPIKGTSNHSIQAVSEEDGGDGIRFANDVTRSYQAAQIEKESYKRELRRSDDPEQVIRERIRGVCSARALSPTAFSSEPARQAAERTNAGREGVTVTELLEIAMAETDQATLAAAVEGTRLADHPLVIGYTEDGGDKTVRASATSAVFISHVSRMGGAESVTIHYEWRRAGGDSWQTTGSSTLTDPGTVRQTVAELEPDTEYEVRGVAKWSDGTTQTTSTITFRTDSLDTDAC